MKTSYNELERLCGMGAEQQERITNLRRCTKCLLPETFPFIHYDGQGVCNYCRSHTPWSGPGVDSLREKLAPYRGKNGVADCLVPISGGRDSSYALHYIVKELGMKPVAYTYDWGMVTDLAARNTARMCKALDVEHILIQADIRRKLENIRKNVLAWMKKPHLGAVPLFMAGDKQMFYHIWNLMRQRGLAVSIVGANPFEETNFKVGFCGIDRSSDAQAHYALSLKNKARLAGFYFGQCMGNPAYVNSSLLDSLAAFISYYIFPASFLSLYDYVKWDEGVVNSTIIGEYDWETSPDTTTTWRIGDGTASLYNYIYYRVAGFSENDTFRSNQIREGMLDREQGLALIAQENMPRLESMVWYCDRVGLDCRELLQRINAITPRYMQQ